MASSEVNRQGARLQIILENDEKVRKQLIQLYKEIEDLLESQPDEILEGEISAHFPCYKESLEKYPNDLQDDTRPLVFTGEVSTGKSTLINALLGSKVLPSGTLPTTGVVCRLISNENKYIQIFHKHEKYETRPTPFRIDVKTEDELQKELKKVVSPKGEEKRMNYNVQTVDIYWPVPFLRRNIMVVDTPGVGENQEVTQRVLDYLPKAVGLIYVIDPTRGGGLAHDRIVPIIKCQMNAVTEDVKPTFDPSCALFVCNKWDLVLDEGDEKEVYEFESSKLNDLWPNFDEKQLHCISAKEVLKKTDKQPIPEEFERFEDAVLKLIENSICAKSRSHAKWMEKFVDHLQLCMNSHLKSINFTVSQRNEKLVEAQTLLRLLEKSRNDSKDKLQRKVDDAFETLSSELQNHYEEMKKRDVVFSWDNITLPKDGKDLDAIKEEAFRIIDKEVRKELTCILQQLGHLAMMSLYDELKRKCKEFDKAKRQITNLLQAEDAKDEKAAPCMAERQPKDDSTDSTDDYIPNWAIAVTVVTAPVWMPLGLVAGLFALIGVGAVKSKEKIEVLYYKTHKVKYMNEWSKEYLCHTDEKIIHKIVTEAFEKIRNDSRRFFEIDVQKIINICDLLISNLKKEGRTAQQIEELYNPLFIKSLEIQEKVTGLVKRLLNVYQ